MKPIRTKMKLKTEIANCNWRPKLTEIGVTTNLCQAYARCKSSAQSGRFLCNTKARGPRKTCSFFMEAWSLATSVVLGLSHVWPLGSGWAHEQCLRHNMCKTRVHEPLPLHWVTAQNQLRSTNGLMFHAQSKISKRSNPTRYPKLKIIWYGRQCVTSTPHT
jgi:hypothetical protein